jgi:uncharacterized protein YdeI (YjbR/CyaY-like superfamily)
MEDPYQSLIQQTKNVQAARQLRFESLDEVNQRRDEIKWYVKLLNASFNSGIASNFACNSSGIS